MHGSVRENAQDGVGRRMRARLGTLLVRCAIACSALPLASQACLSETVKDKARAAYIAALETPNDPEVLGRYLATLPKVTLSLGGDEQTYYLVEGDLPLSPIEVSFHLRQSKADPCVLAAKLAVTKQMDEAAMDRCLAQHEQMAPANDVKGAPTASYIFSLTKAAVDKLDPTFDRSRLKSVSVGQGIAYEATISAEEAGVVLRAIGGSVNADGGFVPELTVHYEDGRMRYWKRGYRTLRYAVLKRTFPTQDAYDNAIREIALAAKDWEALCATCDIDFVHSQYLDRIQTVRDVYALINRDAAGQPDGLRFVVAYAPKKVDFVALSFFPNDPGEKRVIWLTPDYFALSEERIRRGVMRHELGHALGYRHEHIRPAADGKPLPPGCALESGQYEGLTEYDPNSIMHYFCGKASIGEFVYSDTDRRGHERLYGK